MTPRLASGRPWRLAALALVLALDSQAGGAQSLNAAQLLSYSDFGRPEILLTAASIRQTGLNEVAAIDQRIDISTTDRNLYPVGNGNIAEIVQDGDNNEARIQQAGNLNRARVVQDGSFNYATVQQLGVANSADIAQAGLGNLAVISQIGNGNVLTLQQAGNNVANLTEVGNNNTIQVQQVVGGPVVSIGLIGSGLSITVKQ